MEAAQFKKPLAPLKSIAIKAIIRPADEIISSRERLVSSMQRLSDQINANWTYQALDNTSKWNNTTSWSKQYLQSPSGEIACELFWNHVKQPSFKKALNEIIGTHVPTECITVARILRLALVTLVIGEDKLLSLVSNLIAIQEDKNFPIMHDLSWHFFPKVEHDNHDAFYAYPFVNIREYDIYKVGNHKNHNVIKLPDSSYIGFAPTFFYANRTQQKLEQYLFDEFMNDKDIRQGMESQHAAFCKTLTFESFKEARLKYQKSVGYFIFDETRAENF